MYFLLLCEQDKPKHWQRTWQLKNWIKIVHLILNLYQELKYQKNCSKMCACGGSQGQVKSSVQIWRSKGVNVLSQQVNEILNRQAVPCPLDGCILRLPAVVLGEGSGTRVRVLWLLQETAEFLALVPAKVGAHWIPCVTVTLFVQQLWQQQWASRTFCSTEGWLQLCSALISHGCGDVTHTSFPSSDPAPITKRKCFPALLFQTKQTGNTQLPCSQSCTIHFTASCLCLFWERSV